MDVWIADFKVGGGEGGGEDLERLGTGFFCFEQRDENGNREGGEDYCK
jgi:hypothetical protein